MDYHKYVMLREREVPDGGENQRQIGNETREQQKEKDKNRCEPWNEACRRHKD